MRPIDRLTTTRPSMLDPQRVGAPCALHELVRVLRVRLELHLWRHVFGAHAVAAHAPRLPAVVRDPRSAARDADDDVPRVAWIDTDRVNAGAIRPPPEPVLSLRIV